MTKIISNATPLISKAAPFIVAATLGVASPALAQEAAGDGGFLMRLFSGAPATPAPVEAAPAPVAPAPVAMEREPASAPRTRTRHREAALKIPAGRMEAGGLRGLVARHAAAHGVPHKLAHAVVTIESRYQPRVVHAGNYGLMQIRLGTARNLGFRGSAQALLAPETNLHYGMKYLGAAWRASGGDACGAIKRYQTGHGGPGMSAATRAYCAKARVIMAQR